MSGPAHIWRGGVGDAVALAQLHAPVFSDAWPEAAFASLIERDGVIVLLGARGANVSAEGFVLARVAAGEAEVLTFCVSHTARRSGLGRALLNAACDAALADGAVEMFLEVAEDNRPARGLYEASGFLVVGRRAAYYHRGPDSSDALVMRKALKHR